MKLVLFLIFLTVAGFIVVNRQRVYLRDPLAAVYRDDARVVGVQVFINESNDILLEQEAQPGAFQLLVQSWNKMPGSPVVLKCIHSMACLTDADHATTIPTQSNGPGRYAAQVSMSPREVRYTDGNGAKMRVELR